VLKNFISRNTNLLVTLCLVASVAFTLVTVTANTEEHIWSLQYLSLAGISLGCYALSKLRPQRLGLSPPHVMLSLGFGGMFLGLLIDTYITPVKMIASICAGSHQLGLWESLQLHVLLMPFMHIGMLIGGISAIPSLRYLRPQCRKLCSMLTQNILCSTWMLIGMTLGAVVFTQVLQQSNVVFLNLSMMLGGMFTGMVWGMVVSVFLYRQYFRWRDYNQSLKLSRQVN
jgi:hypothetical protein